MTKKDKFDTSFYLKSFYCIPGIYFELIPGANSGTDLAEVTQVTKINFNFMEPGIPLPSMYGIFTYIWLFLMVKYGKCR